MRCRCVWKSWESPKIRLFIPKSPKSHRIPLKMAVQLIWEYTMVCWYTSCSSGEVEGWCWRFFEVFCHWNWYLGGRFWPIKRDTDLSDLLEQPCQECNALAIYFLNSLPGKGFGLNAVCQLISNGWMDWNPSVVEIILAQLVLLDTFWNVFISLFHYDKRWPFSPEKRTHK